MLVITITLLLTCLSISEAVESKTVIINQGPVRGYKAIDSEVFEFFGIRYATAPTGLDKFKAPLPAPIWTETFEAVENNIGCPQSPLLSANLKVTEDCLVVNVLVPGIEARNLSVVVYVHGGAYTVGDGLELSPKPLVESQKVVAVTVNYRLGVHGFLCLGTEDIPGNAGMKDVMAALLWVKENIASFGGNPDDVTLAGYSAGASLADLLSLSKVTKGLFNKLIIDSGAHVAAWSVQIDPVRNAQDYAQLLNFNNVRSLSDLEEFYKTIPFDVLLSDISRLQNYNSDLVFVPCIENDIRQERILDDSPVNIIKSNEYTKFPTLYGFSNMEGLFRVPSFDAWAPKMNENFTEFLVLDLNFENDNQKENVTKTIQEFYFGSNSVGIYTLFNYIDYFTDVMFAYPILRSIKLQVEAGNEEIYLYEYTFYNNFVTVPGLPDILTNFPGADHCAQTEAVLEFTRESDEDRYTEDYKLLRSKLRELWVNFVTIGTPVPEGSPYPAWPAANARRSPHMILGNTIELGDALNERRAQFWDDIYDRYYRHPMPPSFEEPNAASLVTGSIILKLFLVSFSAILI